MVELAWNRIKLEMKEQEVTACALSKKTGIAVNTLKKILEYENDIKVSQLIKICNALNINVKDVFRTY